MKKLFFAFLILPSFLFAQQNTSSKEQGFVISGTVIGLADGSEVRIARTNDNSVIASATTKSGKFNLSGSIPEPGLYWLILGKEQPVHIYLENSRIAVSGNKNAIKSLNISGSQSHKDFMVFQNTFNPLVGDLNGTVAKINMGAQGAELDSLMKKTKAIEKNIQNQIDKFISTRPKSFVSPFLLFVTAELQDDILMLEKRFNTLDATIRNSGIGKSMTEYINYYRVGAVGTSAIDFTQPDTMGTPVSLSSFRGKYVLVDFWASWCAPCRYENPNLVANFNKFKEKNFTVLGVSFDKEGQKDKWLDAIKKDNLTWTQVSDLRGWENAAGQIYRISQIPHNFLVDPNGKIIAKNLRGPELGTKLCELLGCN